MNIGNFVSLQGGGIPPGLLALIFCYRSTQQTTSPHLGHSGSTIKEKGSILALTRDSQMGPDHQVQVLRRMAKVGELVQTAPGNPQKTRYSLLHLRIH